MSIILLLMALFPGDLQGDLFIYDHLLVDQYGIDIVIPWDEGECAELAREWQEQHWHRAVVMRWIRQSYKDIDWAFSDTFEFFGDMPFITDGCEDTEYQTLLREIIQL